MTFFEDQKEIWCPQQEVYVAGQAILRDTDNFGKTKVYYNTDS